MNVGDKVRCLVSTLDAEIDSQEFKGQIGTVDAIDLIGKLFCIFGYDDSDDCHIPLGAWLAPGEIEAVD